MITTSNFARNGNNPNAVAISIGVPRGWKGRRYFKLAPSREMLEALSKNIAKEKRLESLPFVVKRIKGESVVFELISGHHRVRASRMAGVNYIYVLADTRDLNRSKTEVK